MLIDTHAHLQDEQLKAETDNILARAEEAGVKKIACVGYDLASSMEALQMAKKYTQIYAVVGIHPDDTRSVNPESLEQIYAMGRDARVVGIGEIGLDYYHDIASREEQKKAFIAHIKIAQELDKPVIIHNRDAHQDVLEIIKQEKAGKSGGIMHCYSGSLPMAEELIKLGFYISFAGPVTFKNAKKAHQVAASIDTNKLLIETDCPYLSPEPFRGKLNEPARVEYVARKIAELRNSSLEEIAAITSSNAREIYRIAE